MKKVYFALILFSAFLFFNCKRGCKESTPITLYDTIYVDKVIQDTTCIDSLENVIFTLQSKLDSLDTTISYENYINAKRIEKIKYYISITEKNSNNRQFFFGWIRRAVADN